MAERRSDDGRERAVLEFMRLLWALDHGLAAKSKQMKTTLGVTSPQRLVIRMVGRQPGIAAGEIATALHVHPSTLTGVLNRLERRGFIDRKSDRSDARRALFSLTTKGKKIDQIQVGTVEERVAASLDALLPAKIEAAKEVLARLGEALTS